MKSKPTGHIKDLKPDASNVRKHNPRNIGMIADALNEVGAARSIVIDEENNILAGNGTVEAAGQAGITRMKIVEADGNEIVAVRRRGLTPEQKKRLALFDNRTAELADWDAEILKQLADDGDGAALKNLFYDGELKELLESILAVAPEEFPLKDENIEIEHVCPKCGYRFSGGKTTTESQ